MTEIFENILRFNEQLSGTMNRITASSNLVQSSLSALRKQTMTIKEGIDGVTVTVTSLEERAEALQSQEKWVSAENVAMARSFNQELKGVAGAVEKVETASAGGKFKKWGKDVLNSLIPIKSLIPSPATIAEGIRKSLTNAMDFEQGMAKVNVSAQLDEKGLSELSDKIRQVAIKNKADINVAPAGFEKINAQVRDTDLSLSILDASLKGSKAGFVDLDTVSGALTQSLRAIGKENTNAQEVLDTFFAANRMGAGSFADLARQMPGLISGASSMGVNFKEVAGTFAYMTGKGESAERASALMQSAFEALGQADVRGKLEKAGVSVFDDQGNIRSMVDIFTQLGSTLDGMNYEEKTAALAGFGITGKDAADAFSLLTSDLDNYQIAMASTANATGETDKQLENSQTGVSKLSELWDQFGNIGTQLGTIVMPAVNKVLNVASDILSGLSIALEPVIGFFRTWSELLQNGNPLIWGATTVIALLTSAIIANSMAGRIKAIWDGIQAVSTTALTAAQWALNAAFLGCPLVWIVVGIGAVVAAVVYCWNKFEGFRKVIYGAWEVMKAFGASLFDSIVSPFKQILKGLGSVGAALGSLVKGNFKEAATQAKQGFKDIGEGMLKANPISIAVDAVNKTDFKGAYNKGSQKGVESWEASQKVKNKGKDEGQQAQSSVEDLLPNMSDYVPTPGKTGKGNAAQGGRLPGIPQMAAAMTIPLAMGGGGNALSPDQYAMTDFNGGAPMEQTAGMGMMPQAQGGGGKTIQIDRVCDQIVIHVQNTDGKGTDTIRQEIIKVFNEIYEI